MQRYNFFFKYNFFSSKSKKNHFHPKKSSKKFQSPNFRISVPNFFSSVIFSNYAGRFTVNFLQQN